MRKRSSSWDADAHKAFCSLGRCLVRRWGCCSLNTSLRSTSATTRRPRRFTMTAGGAWLGRNRWTAIAQAALAFEQRTESQNGRLVEPLRHELDNDRQG